MLRPGDLLWLPGISGCGKSVLWYGILLLEKGITLTTASSTVICDLEQIRDLDPFKHLAYWYFYFGDDATQNVDAMVRSLIRQLSQPPLASSLVNLWNKHHYQGSQPDSQAILGVLDDVLSKINGHVYLVFDALDECPDNGPKGRQSLLSLLMGLLERYKDKVHILATSRPEQDISRELEKFSRVDLEVRLGEDVKTFVEAALSRRPLSRYNDEVKNLIADTLLSSKERYVYSFLLEHFTLYRVAKL